MSAKRADAEKVEAYTRALLEAARSEGRANADLVQWQHAQKFTPEVLETLAAMQKEDDLGLIEEVAKQYKELLDAHDTTVSVTVTTAVPIMLEVRGKRYDASVRAQLANIRKTLSSTFIEGEDR